MSDTLTGRRAVVVDSGPLGRAIAHELARRGASLLLVGSDADALAQAGDIETLHLDLTQPDAPETLLGHLKSGPPVDILVNSAEPPIRGRFTEADWSVMDALLQAQVATFTGITRLLAAEMVTHGGGYILNVASAGAFQPSPHYALYTAAKSFTLTFSEAINFELHGTGVSVTVTCPPLAAMPPADIARVSVNAMLRRQTSIVPNRRSALAVWLARLLPRQLVARLAENA